MSILAECPICRRKQSLKNKLCRCGEDLDKLKRARKVRYWINYRLPGDKQRREPVGYSITEARAADGKRRAQKRENRIFEMLPESKMTFNELTEWYLDLESVKMLASFERNQIALENFNKIHGEKTVGTIQPVDLEKFQALRKKQNIANVTVDLELSKAKTMINKAFDNDLVDGRVLKVFLKVKKFSRKNETIRSRTLTLEEYLKILDAAAPHLRGWITVAYNTGMRPGEVSGLKWSYIDRRSNFIRLPANATKEKKEKAIPMNHHVADVLNRLLRHINHDYVFTYKGKPLRQSGGPFRSFRTACRKAGIPYGKKEENGIIAHDIRRTFKTNCVKAGIDKVYRDIIVGHSLMGMDSHYIVPTDEDLRAAVGKFTEWLDKEIKKIVDYFVDKKDLTY